MEGLRQLDEFNEIREQLPDLSRGSCSCSRSSRRCAT